MDRSGDTAVVAIRLPEPQAAGEITAAWDRGEAVAVLDPRAPDGVVEAVLAAVRPTHLVDTSGRRARPDGVPTAPTVRAVVVTSGTTGAPKGAELTLAGMDSIGWGWAHALGPAPADRPDRWLVCLPLHHVAGLAILARARVTATPVTVHEGFDLDAVARAPRASGATLVSLVPTTLARLLDAGAPLHEYRCVAVGGAPTPPALRARADLAGARVVDAYGMSETWGGYVLDGTPIGGAEVSLGDDGEILVRGPMVMRGYRLRPGESAAAFLPDGRLRTGDVGVLDAAGRLRVVDRKRDLVITGGVNVSPIEVEAVLAAHPDVADAAVAGAPDDEWGERVVAFVVPRRPGAPPTLAQLRRFAAERLPAAKLPRELVLRDEIPRSPGGKVLRGRLRPPG